MVALDGEIEACVHIPLIAPVQSGDDIADVRHINLILACHQGPVLHADAAVVEAEKGMCGVVLPVEFQQLVFGTILLHFA